DTSSKFNISWKVPTIGSPEYEFSFFNESSYFKKYDVIKNNAFDDTVFQVTINENIKPPSSPIILIILITIFVSGLIIVIFIAYRYINSDTPPVPNRIPGMPAVPVMI